MSVQLQTLLIEKNENLTPKDLVDSFEGIVPYDFVENKSLEKEILSCLQNNGYGEDPSFDIVEYLECIAEEVCNTFFEENQDFSSTEIHIKETPTHLFIAVAANPSF